MPQCCSEVRLGDEVVATSRTATNDDNEEFPICSLIRRAAEYSASSGPALDAGKQGGRPGPPSWQGPLPGMQTPLVFGPV
jgi:hypothetical protein